MLDRHQPESTHLLYPARRKNDACLVAMRAETDRYMAAIRGKLKLVEENSMVSERLTAQQAATGLKVALRVIGNWDATQSQACRILRISPATYRRAVRGFAAGQRLDRDQQQRIVLVLGIHASLRTVFSNRENVKGFTGFKNDNSFFAGRSPLEVMAQGDMISLYETFKRIQHLRLAC